MSQMKFRIGDPINGTEYDAQEALEKVSLSTLYELKVRTGIGMQTLVRMAESMKDFADEPMRLLEDKEAFQAFRVILWLARRHAGEKGLSLDQATDFPIQSLFLYSDDPEPEGDPDPKATAGSAADANADAASEPATTSRT